LIPTEGSELAGKAVTAGLALAKRLGSKVTTVAAIESWFSIASSDTATAFMEYQKAAEQDGARILGQVSTTGQELGIRCETSQ
jgi:nucleotide-binding universal stress UspA family protein